MEAPLILRPAEITDYNHLALWRNDAETRAQSINQDPVTHTETLKWLYRSLKNPDRTIYICVDGNDMVGTCRADKVDGRFELSWTVAPYCRAMGYASQMVPLAIEKHPSCFARIKPGNHASIKVAKRAGMTLCGEDDGLLVYFRKP